jgi:hypothetical protein
MSSRRNGVGEGAFDPILQLPVLPNRSARAAAPARAEGWSELTSWKDQGLVPFSIAWEKWRRSGGADGVAGIKAFVLAVENGCVPPGEILQWVASAFEQFYVDEQPIERLLRLTAPPGERSPLQGESDAQARQAVFLIMSRLVAFGARIPDAAVLAHACWRRDADAGRTRSRVLSVSTLESAYRRWSPATKRMLLDGDRRSGGGFVGWRAIANAMTLRDLDKHLRQIPNTRETAPIKAKLRAMYASRAGSRTSHRPFG